MSEGMTLRSHTKDKTLLDEVTRSSDTTIKVEGEDGSKVHEYVSIICSSWTMADIPLDSPFRILPTNNF